MVLESQTGEFVCVCVIIIIIIIIIIIFFNHKGGCLCCKDLIEKESVDLELTRGRVSKFYMW